MSDETSQPEAPAAAQNEQPQNTQVITTESAFVMYMDDEGHWLANPDFTRPMMVQRQANSHDFAHAAGDLLRDLASFEAAVHTVNLSQQAAAQMAQAAMARDIAQRTGIGGAALPDLAALRRH